MSKHNRDKEIIIINVLCKIMPSFSSGKLIRNRGNVCRFYFKLSVLFAKVILFEIRDEW